MLHSNHLQQPLLGSCGVALSKGTALQRSFVKYCRQACALLMVLQLKGRCGWALASGHNSTYQGSV